MGGGCLAEGRRQRAVARGARAYRRDRRHRRHRAGSEKQNLTTDKHGCRGSEIGPGNTGVYANLHPSTRKARVDGARLGWSWDGVAQVI